MLMASALCLALNMYHEARGEGDEGLLAVANVTKNRVESELFGGTYCDVVFDHYQFSWTIDEISDQMKDPVLKARCIDLALRFLLKPEDYPDNTGEALWYHANHITPDWAADYDVSAKIGNHIFYTNE